MSREWKPGDVAMVRFVNGSSEHRAMRDVDGEGWGVVSHHGSLQVADARPLVVIDPEDHDEVGRLSSALHANGLAFCNVRDITAALRQFANPAPPEPTDPRSRVTDRRENVWRLLADGDWVCTSGPDHGEYLVWSRLAAERGPLQVEVVPS